MSFFIPNYNIGYMPNNSQLLDNSQLPLSFDENYYKYHISKLEKKIEQLETMVEKLLVLNKLENDIQTQNHGYGNMNILSLKNSDCQACNEKFSIDDCIVYIKSSNDKNLNNKNSNNYFSFCKSSEKIFIHNKCYLKMISLDNKDTRWLPESFNFEFERYKLI